MLATHAILSAVLDDKRSAAIASLCYVPLLLVGSWQQCHKPLAVSLLELKAPPGVYPNGKEEIQSTCRKSAFEEDSGDN